MRGLLKKIEVFNKKTVKVMLSLAMVFAVIMPNMSVTVKAETPTIPDGATQILDSNTWWKWDQANKTLIFGGEGAIPDCNLVYLDILNNGTPHWTQYINDIEKVIFEEGITIIGENCLYRTRLEGNVHNSYTKLTEIVFPSTLTKIDKHAFWGCPEIESIIIPSNVVVGEGAFAECSKLSAVTIKDGATVNRLAFQDCSLSEINIVGNNVAIDSEAFKECADESEQGLSVNLSGDYIDIDSNAFRSTTGNIRSLIINGNHIELNSNVFDCDELNVLQISGEYITLKKDSISGFEGDNLTISASNLTIEEDGLGVDCESLIFSGDNLTLGELSLGSCLIKEIVIEGENAVIGSYLFGDATAGVEKIEFKKNATSIEEDAFEGIGPQMLIMYLLFTPNPDYSVIEDEDLRAIFENAEDAYDAYIAVALSENVDYINMLMAPYGDPACELILPENWSLEPMDEDGSFYGGMFKTSAAHTHSGWTYEVTNGNTIVATCNGTGDCNLPNNKVSLTLTASSANYLGNAVQATFGDGEADAWEAATGNDAPTIKYIGRSNTTYPESETAPTEVGKYEARVTIDVVTAKVIFEIKSASNPTTPETPSRPIYKAPNTGVR